MPKSINIAKQIESARRIVIMFILFSGGLYFLFYILEFKKYKYILEATIIYSIGRYLRNKMPASDNKTHISELGMFFLSLVLLAYLLYIFKLDSDVINYLPNKLVNGSTVIIFVFFLISFILTPIRAIKENVKLLIFFSLFGLAFLLRSVIHEMDYFISQHQWIGQTIIGIPIIYLIFLTFGIDISGTMPRKKITPN